LLLNLHAEHEESSKSRKAPKPTSLFFSSSYQAKRHLICACQLIGLSLTSSEMAISIPLGWQLAVHDRILGLIGDARSCYY
jgi:hypothetical protein